MAHKGAALIRGKRDGSVWSIGKVFAGSMTHPTEKPVDICVMVIRKFSDQGNIVLDPFMGSGTTLRAAKDLGRKAIGIEIEERYAEIAAKRLEQEILPLSFESNVKPSVIDRGLSLPLNEGSL